MAKVRYQAVIEKTDSGGHSVWFPDFPGCVSAGDTWNAALAGAREALELHLEGMAEDGEAFPAPTSFFALSDDMDFSQNVPLAIEVEAPAAVAPRSVRLNITMPEPLVERIDQAAPDNRSAWLADAAREKLRRALGLPEAAQATYQRLRKRMRAFAAGRRVELLSKAGLLGRGGAGLALRRGKRSRAATLRGLGR